MWSEVQAAAGEAGRSADRLNQLIVKYQRPLRGYLLHLFRAFPAVTKDADDLLQGFAQERVLQEGWLAKASPSKGRFRNLLKTSLRNYVISQARKARPPGIPIDELEAVGIELPAPEPVQDPFDAAFVQVLLKETLEQMEQDCKGPGRPQPHSGHIWDLFCARVIDPILRNSDPPSYQTLVSRFGLRSPSEGTNMLLTGKRIFKRHLMNLIAQYEGDAQAEAELAVLIEFISGLEKTG